MRTLTFREPLQVVNAGVDADVDADNNADADGLYVKCRLASDNEPNRRVWKMTIRTDSSRGELVYQSQFDIPQSTSFKSPFSFEEETEKEEQDQDQDQEELYHTIFVPFASFQQVRGPRIVPNGGEPLDLSKGIYQIGMTMSKFQMGLNTTELDNFRAGYFDLHIQQIGLYSDCDSKEGATETATETETENAQPASTPTPTPTSTSIQTLTKKEMLQKRPLIFKILLSISKIFFSEQANRRKSAMNILRQKRNMSRIQAIQFGLRSRRQSMGLISSVGKTLSILGIDTFRAVLTNVLKVALVYPLTFIRKFFKAVAGNKKEKNI